MTGVENKMLNNFWEGKKHNNKTLSMWNLLFIEYCLLLIIIFHHMSSQFVQRSLSMFL